MAIVRNPAFSIAMSGTLGGVLTVRTAQHRCVASLPMRPTVAATAAQAACRLRGAWAASTWASLEQWQRDKWATLAAAESLPPFGLYLKEFCLQRSTLTNLPLMPKAAP